MSKQKSWSIQRSWAAVAALTLTWLIQVGYGYWVDQALLVEINDRWPNMLSAAVCILVLASMVWGRRRRMIHVVFPAVFATAVFAVVNPFFSLLPDVFSDSDGLENSIGEFVSQYSYSFLFQFFVTGKLLVAFFLYVMTTLVVTNPLPPRRSYNGRLPEWVDQQQPERSQKI